LQALGTVTYGLKSYFLTHVCYGEFSKIYDKIINIPVDNLDIEISNSNLDLIELFKQKKFPKDVSFGVVDVHSHKIEDINTVKNRIRTAISVLGKDQVWVDPDCGLKTRTVEEAVNKLKVIVQATKEVRKEIR
ncbi:MAG: methionine synthase, partial [Planctomycetes bacterium]|nr:methionine synthase [Planctomycetota bacterium]